MSDLIECLSRKLKIDNSLSTVFILMFSRFEYSLKNIGCFIGSEKKVSADWDGYSRKEEIKEIFNNIEEQEIIDAVNYLIENPPKKQVIIDDNVVWKNSPPDSNLPKSEQAILMVRRIRNNLMHGGKFHGAYQPEVARDTKLIESSIHVLNYCLQCDHEIHYVFSM